MDNNRRSRNLVVHNLPEQEETSRLEPSHADIQLFRSMVWHVLKLNVRATRSFWAGKPLPGKERMMVTLENEDWKFEILRMAFQLKLSHKWKMVFITPNLSYKETQDQKKLRGLCQQRRRGKAGESNLTIKTVSLDMTQTGPRHPTDYTSGSLMPNTAGREVVSADVE